MSASNVNNAVGPRQVTCETSDNYHVPVDLNILRVSRTFTKMYDDLGLEEHDEFPGVFPLKTINSRVFIKVFYWCKRHKDEPEPVIDKDPLTQECTWFTLTDYEKKFFDVTILELLELVMAANFLDIPGLYHKACQSVAARIKGKHPVEICEALQQDCDLDRARIWKLRKDNPWLSSVFPGARIRKAIFIPNEVLLTIFEKLPREDLERLQLVSTQFNDVIVSSSELSAQQGPLRVVAKLEFGASSRGRFSQRIDLWLGDGTRVTCPDYKNLAKRLKFGIVQTLRVGYYADVKDLTALLPIKSAWKHAKVEAFFAGRALFEFAFTQLLLCKKIILGRERGEPFTWSRPYMRLPAVVACNKLDISRLSLGGEAIHPADVVEWTEQEVPQEVKWSEPRQMVLNASEIIGGIGGLLTALKTAFSTSIRSKPYVVRVRQGFYRFFINDVLANEKTQELLCIRAGQNGNWDVLVERA